MCYHHPSLFPQVLSNEIYRVNVVQALHAWIPPYITGSLHHIPMWLDFEFQYYDIYEIKVVGIQRHYHDTDDILWDAILVITLITGRYLFIIMPMINGNIRDWNHINFFEIYRNTIFYEPSYPIQDAMGEQGYSCNMFRYYEGCDTVTVGRRVLDDYLLVPDDEHVRFTNVVTLS